MDFSVIINSVVQFAVDAYQSLLVIKETLKVAAEAAIAEEKSSIWATLITDIITVAAALGALALPVSLNVIEAARTRYRSPSLLKLTSSLSGVDAKNLNRQLFLILAASVVAKVYISLQIYKLILLVPYLCALTIWFGCVVIRVYWHLRFTYVFMSNIESVQGRIFKVINKYAGSGFLEGCGGQGKVASVYKKIKMYIFGRVTVQNEISAFLELESHLLCTDASKIDLDDQFKKISYQAFQRLEIDEANEFAHHLLASLPNLLAVVEVSREVDVYQRVAGFYLHLAMGALLSKEEYRSQIGVIERIARFREEKLPLYGRFCRTGRLFMSFANKAKVGKEAYSYLQAHFNLLVETSVREQPENIPELLGNIRSVIQFKGNYNQSAWDIPERVPELWGCPCLPELSRYVTETYAGRLSPDELNEKIESQYMPEMRAFIGSRISDLAVLNEKIETIDMALEECWKGIALNRFSSEIEIVTLRALASLLSNHPEIFIECRELRNPAGSRSFNVGHSPVPTSLGECVTEFVSAKNYSDFYAVRNDLQEYQIVDAIGALIVYELWNMFVLRAVGATIKPEIHKPVIQSCQIGELQDAEQRVDLLEVSVMKALANSRFVDRLGVLPDQLLSLKKYASQFCEFLRDAIKEKKEVQVACQKLDPEAVERFKKEVTDAIGVSIAGYEIFKRFVVGQVKPIVFNVSLPREAFLSSTNTYYMFDAYGANLAREIHNWLNAQVLFGNPKTESAEVTLPVHKGERLICSGQALKKFLSAGFKISGGDLLWPDEKGTMKFIEVNCTGDGYYLVFPGENLLVVNPAYRENGLPLSMSYTDDGGDVSFKIECYVGVQH